MIVLETGVFFPMLDLDRPRTRGVVCFHTGAGFKRMANQSDVNQQELRELFRTHRKAIERLANELQAPKRPGYKGRAGWAMQRIESNDYHDNRSVRVRRWS